MARKNSKTAPSGDDAVPPAWFRAYESRLNDRFDTVENRMNSLDARFGALNPRCEEISRRQAEQGSLIAENSREIRELDQLISSEVADMREHLTDSANEISALRVDLNAAAAAAASRPVSASHLGLLSSADTCEVRIAGIPPSVKTDSVAAAEVESQSALVSAPASSSSARRTMVVCLASAGARDTLLAAAPRLRLLTIGSIFGIDHDGPNRLHMSAILPGPLYDLYKKCQAACRTLWYPPPVVRGIRIFKRQAQKSPLIPITCEANLAKLKPNSS
ncbi:hypothetical protein TKK_0018916 [Trichogramma kaykai]|uniref:Uncharacterized protein n=1 Tax=Trichogramma kaykai TaxID=54128 RepID=A0ABD2VVA8_9HYME